MSDSAVRTPRFGDRVEIVEGADYIGKRGVVEWVDDDRLGVWLDGQFAGNDMPVTFLVSEVRCVR